MFKLAHLSDLHLASPPHGAQLLSKRGLGYVNWLRKRRNIHRLEVLDALAHDLKSQNADHIAVTGDLVNFSLPQEYARAAGWLSGLGGAKDVTAMPGNHDVYVRNAEPMPERFWTDYMRGDDGVVGFPFLRRRGDLALIALSTGVATGPFMATGRLGPRQITRLGEILTQTREQFRVVLIHHPPVSPPRRYLRRLVDAPALRAVLAAHGAELLLHGHDHRSAIVWLDGPQKQKIPAVGVPSASAALPHGEEGAAAYHLFTIERTERAGSPAWHCNMVERQRGADGLIRETAGRDLFQE